MCTTSRPSRAQWTRAFSGMVGKTRVDSCLTFRLFLFVPLFWGGSFLLMHGLEGDDLETLHPAGDLDGHFLSLPPTGESLSDRRSDRDESACDSGIVGDDAIVSDVH